ncbi:pollen-specific leucine-rich repeat extensin-like protein 4 [Iris pallida]|uniref:Pollen-specific leucine-rich repeat extensin-like protein 4 n=1 Tax=Iris pallida TaxID=29817 RepID=A0AAX6DQ23_IRIPA|nr:pollen-specific leucine-rich repeat extensin-like protein 4 [Iris pallida]
MGSVYSTPESMLSFVSGSVRPCPTNLIPPLQFNHVSVSTCDTDVQLPAQKERKPMRNCRTTHPKPHVPPLRDSIGRPKIYESSASSPTSGPDRSTVADRGREPPAIRPGQSPPSRRAVSPPSRLLCS